MKFLKMHALGNDFVIVDGRGEEKLNLPDRIRQRLGERRRGVGFDQLAVIQDSQTAGVRLEFWNQDGSPSATCGNATRCVARLLMDEWEQHRVVIETDHGHLVCEDSGSGRTRVNMGRPSFEWQNIPLAKEVNTSILPIDGDPCALSLGNPHCVFFVKDCSAVEIETLGPRIENHPLFPQKTNVELVQILAPNTIRMRIWERGVGRTLASGSGACAAAVAAHHRGFSKRHVFVETEGGQLEVDWREDGVWKTGNTTLVFEGQLSADWILDT